MLRSWPKRCEAVLAASPQVQRRLLTRAPRPHSYHGGATVKVTAKGQVTHGSQRLASAMVRRIAEQILPYRVFAERVLAHCRLTAIAVCSANIMSPGATVLLRYGWVSRSLPGFLIRGSSGLFEAPRSRLCRRPRPSPAGSPRPPLFPRGPCNRRARCRQLCRCRLCPAAFRRPKP